MQQTDPGQNGAERLDSWKSIAAYLRRDERTVRRWERELGLPVRRVADTPRAAVYAFRPEIDAWLARRPVESIAPKAARVAPYRLMLVVIAACVAAAAALAWSTTGAIDLATARIEETPTAITARDASGREYWRHEFPADRTTGILPASVPPVVVRGPSPFVLAGSSLSTRNADGVLEGGSLLALDKTGSVTHTFTFDDTVRMRDKTLGPPWVMTAFASEPDARRIAVTAHHYMWDPGLVTILDSAWHRTGTFVNPGWIESVHWLSPHSVLVGGYSNEREAGLVAILDPGDIQTAMRMIAMPRSEVNRAAAAPFNRAVVQVTGDRVIARTIEVASEPGAADAIYEFTPSLELISASFSERYWDEHRALQALGKLDHTVEKCPERNGPAMIEVWDRQGGWRQTAIRRAPSESR